MNSRERVKLAVSHKVTDRVPINGKFLPKFMNKLKAYFGTDDDEQVKDWLGIDFKRVTMSPPETFRNRANKPPFVDIGTGTETFMIFCKDGVYEDEWGVRRKSSISEECWQFIYHPLKDQSLGKYKFPDLSLPGRLYDAIKQSNKFKSDYIISAVLPNLFKHAWTLRGWDNFLMDLSNNEMFVEKLLDRLMEFKYQQIMKFIEEVEVDIIELGGDIGMQNSMIISPEMWRRFFKPRLREIIQRVKGKVSQIWFFFHSDGYIKPIISDLIEIGFDILNPIQPECMDPTEIKKLYGDRISFDGTISLQKTLPFGTEEDVKKEVIMRIKTCGMNGGLILAPSNDVTSDVPIENIITLYKTAREYRL